jgi:hypothetical protein
MIFIIPLEIPDSLSERKPSLYYNPNGLRMVRIRLKRLTHDLNSFRSVNELYEELLDCFVANGKDRRPRPPKSSSAPEWVTFVPDEYQEVRNYPGYLFLFLFIF